MTSAGDTTSGDEQMNPMATVCQKDGNPMATLCQKLFKKEVVQPPPLYVKGEDVTNHIEKIKEYCNLAELTSHEDKITILMNTLPINLQKELKMTHGFKDSHQNFQATVDMFRRVCEQKKSKITPLIKLFEVKQAQHQHIDEFIREIRMRAHDVIYDYPEDEREDLMVKCLIKGVRNENISSALSILAPKTLEEAWKLIKKEDKKTILSVTNSVDVVHCTSSCEKKMQELERQLQKLEDKVTKLTNMRTWQSGTFADAVRGKFPARNSRFRNRPNGQGNL
ncbi:MAG: hypothetical protein AAGK05_17510, partial [Pseudomonadota bacterium]